MTKNGFGYTLYAVSSEAYKMMVVVELMMVAVKVEWMRVRAGLVLEMMV
jgi:hypothetical protein